MVLICMKNLVLLSLYTFPESPKRLERMGYSFISRKGYQHFSSQLRHLAIVNRTIDTIQCIIVRFLTLWISWVLLDQREFLLIFHQYPVRNFNLSLRRDKTSTSKVFYLPSKSLGRPFEVLLRSLCSQG